MLKDKPKVHFATTNRNKFLEAKSIMKEYGVELIFLGKKGLEIQSDSLEEIAKQSAIATSMHMKIATIAEDAGLFIDTLRGFPGPYSSFVFRTLGCDGILKLLEGNSERKAKFVSAIAYCDPPHQPTCFSAVSKGLVGTETRGAAGFGFDPIFVPESGKKTFAEMSTVEKNKYSHRARAFRKFAEWFAPNVK